jgi:hypothetical protein
MKQQKIYIILFFWQIIMKSKTISIGPIPNVGIGIAINDRLKEHQNEISNKRQIK